MGLGAGGSGCRITLDHPRWDGLAARQLVDFLAGTKAAADGTRLRSVRMDGFGDPRIGMVGGSYGGAVQFAAASVDRRIDALVPMNTWNDLRYSLAPSNAGRPGARPGATKLVWGLGFFALGAYRGLASGDASRLGGCPNFPDQMCHAVAESLLYGVPRQRSLEYLRAASVASYVGRVKAPVLLVQGQDDSLFNLREATATFRALDAQGTPVKMVWSSGGHSGPPAPGDVDLESPGTNYVGRRVLAWFDRDLKGRPVGTGPRFAYYRPWVDYDGDAAPAYGTAPARAERRYLSGRDDLVASRAQVARGRARYANLLGPVPTSFSELSMMPLDDVPPADAPGTFAGWTGRPLQRPLDVVGSPALSVRLASPAAEWSQRTGPAGRLVLFAKLYDVAPDGTASLVHRLVSPVRVTNVREPLTVRLPGIVHRFRPGHRLRVVIASSDLNYLGNRAVLPVTVKTGPVRPGVLTLPVAPRPGYVPRVTSVERARVIAYRYAAQGLGSGDAGAVLATGLQDYPAGRSAALALRLRTGPVPDAATVLVHSIRGALHLHHAADLPGLAAALRVEDGGDLPAPSIGAFGAELGTAFGAALDDVAAAMRETTRDGGLGKGELSAAITPRVDRRLAPWCAGCGVHHVQDQLFRRATLQAGLVAEAGPGGVRYRPAGPPAPADPDGSRARLVAAFLTAFGPARPAHLASWAGLTPAAARRWWTLAGALRPVEVDGTELWAHPEQRLDKAPDPEGVRLLPPYDPITELADRTLLVPDPARRSAVWRATANPGVLLVDGEIAGTWRQKRTRDRLTLRVEPFRPLDGGRRRAAEADAAAIADHTGASRVEVLFS